MTADALHIRRARVAIYGPAATGVVGVLLFAAGVIGITHGQLTHRRPVVASGGPTSAAVPTRGQFRLVGADGRMYVRGDLAHPRAATAKPLPTSANHRVVGAANSETGGVWLAGADGHVYPVSAPAIGNASLGAHAARIVGIANASNGAGYRLVAADGHVYAFGASDRGQYTLPKGTPRVVGIATATNDGYWLALADGTVSPVDAPTLSHLSLPKKAARVVAIAASLDGAGYWLATADGHVHAYGVPFRGDLSTTHVKARVVGIATSAQDGYWLTTADGKVYPFAAPAVDAPAKTKLPAPISAIVPY